MDFKNKKLLILGGASVHVKLIKAAQEMGVYTVVTDNVSYEQSPGKQLADEYWDLDIYNIQEIVKKAKRVNINGVISGWLDPCQRPYFQICKELNLPCYGNKEQFFKMTDKHAFKKLCEENSIDTIPEFREKDIVNGNVEFPVFVKPVDSRGSRGQTVCYTMEELIPAMELAKSESSNGDILVEKYIKGNQEFHVTYFFVNGEPYLLRTSDNYCGEEELHMEKVVSCAVMPSRYTKNYIETAHPNVVKMFKKLGVQNGPIFMQGFEDNGVFRFFDPGLRFPGVDYELVFKKVFGIDLMKAMVQIALTGKTNVNIPDDAPFIKGYRAAVLYLTVRACTITYLGGESEIYTNEHVVSYLPRCREGEKITWEFNVNQRLGEADLLCPNTNELIKTIEFVNSTLIATDENGEDAIFSRFDTSRIDN